MLITDKGNLGIKRAFFTIGKRKTIGKKQSKTNRRAVGLEMAFYRVYTCRYTNKYTEILSVNSFMLYLRCKSNI